MKNPTIAQKRTAAEWLDYNDGAKAPDCKAVAKWLRETAAKAELDDAIWDFAKKQGITIPDHKFAKVRAALVAKFSKATT